MSASGKEDRRTKYSKKMIREALFELMKDKPLNKVTVKEICDRADINRSTFYAYYLDIYDLHQQIIKEFFETQNSLNRVTSEVLKKHDYSVPFTGDELFEISAFFFRMVRENRELYKFVYNQNSTNSIHASFGKSYFSKIKDSMPAEFVNKNYVELKNTFNFINGGVTAIIIDWILRDCSDDAEALAGSVSDYCATLFRVFIYT